jgi:hypothetical protein
MSTALTVVLAVVAVLVLLAVGGGLANARRERLTRAPFQRRLSAVDRQLAAALAEDRGWERSNMEALARRELDARMPGRKVDELELVQVVDHPGTDADEAVFRAHTDRGPATIRLGRRGGDWYVAALEA